MTKTQQLKTENKNAKSVPRKRGASSFDVVNYAKIVLKEDTIIERTDEELTLQYSEVVPFFDFNNDFITVLSDIARTSSTHKRIIKQKTRMSIGDGFNVAKKKYSLFQRQGGAVTEGEKDILDGLLLSVNAKNESLLKVTEKAFAALYTYGNAYIQIARTKSGDGHTYKAVSLLTKKCLIKKYKTEPSEMVYCQNFMLPNKQRYTIPLYPNFATVEGRPKSVEYSIIHLKLDDPEFETYGLPEITSALLWAGLEYRIPKFNNRKFSEGFMPSAIVQLFGRYSSAEAKKAVKSITDKFTGDAESNKLFVQVLSDEKSAAKVQTIEQKDGAFLELDKMATQKICIAHGWTLGMVGYEQAGSLGNNQNLKTDFLIAYDNIIKPLQEMMAQEFVNVFLNLATNGGDYSLSFSNSIPTAFLGDIDLNEVLTVDERRKILGYEPLNNVTQ